MLEKRWLAAAAMGILLALSPVVAAQPFGACGFELETLSFHGEPREQARCLLRPVGRYGHLGEPLAILPAPLEELVGAPVDISIVQLRAYLAAQNVSESEIGGSLDQPLSRTRDGLPAAYFVIHDTSTPNYGERGWPATFNESSWRYNGLSHWAAGERSKAHVFINRLGESITAVEFSRGWRAVKLELQVAGVASRGRFLHVENVQPRRSDPHGPNGNDAIAPMPGFTEAQLNRLALVYLAASVRAGRWLVPGFHAVLDSGLRDAHDDPQNFDLNAWAAAIAAQRAAIGAASTQGAER